MNKEILGILAVDKGNGKGTQDLANAQNKILTKEQEKAQKVRQFRAEASRMASMANKRVDRLEKNDLKNTPAYKGYISSGGGKFSVKGKTYNEVQAEVARMRAFIEANTSTISGVNTYLKEMAVNTGIKYSNMTDLYKKADRFFELSAKVEEYLRTVEDMASAIGYQKIWEAINQYVATSNIDLSESNNDIDTMIEDITKALTEHQKPENITISGDANFITEDGLTQSAWFKLPKE